MQLVLLYQHLSCFFILGEMLGIWLGRWIDGIMRNCAQSTLSFLFTVTALSTMTRFKAKRLTLWRIFTIELSILTVTRTFVPLTIFGHLSSMWLRLIVTVSCVIFYSIPDSWVLIKLSYRLRRPDIWAFSRTVSSYSISRHRDFTGVCQWWPIIRTETGRRALILIARTILRRLLLVRIRLSPTISIYAFLLWDGR